MGLLPGISVSTQLALVWPIEPCFGYTVDTAGSPILSMVGGGHWRRRGSITFLSEVGIGLG